MVFLYLPSGHAAYRIVLFHFNSINLSSLNLLQINQIGASSNIFVQMKISGELSKSLWPCNSLLGYTFVVSFEQDALSLCTARVIKCC